MLLLLGLFNLRVFAERRFSADSYANARPLIFLDPGFLQSGVSFKSAQEEYEHVTALKNLSSTSLFQYLNAIFCYDEASKQD